MAAEKYNPLNAALNDRHYGAQIFFCLTVVGVVGGIVWFKSTAETRAESVPPAVVQQAKMPVPEIPSGGGSQAAYNPAMSAVTRPPQTALERELHIDWGKANGRAFIGMTLDQAREVKGLPEHHATRDYLSPLERASGGHYRLTYLPLKPGLKPRWVLADESLIVIASSDEIPGWDDLPADANDRRLVDVLELVGRFRVP
jgi:hypothetical protein